VIVAEVNGKLLGNNPGVPEGWQLLSNPEAVKKQWFVKR
jgi:hypothetical protein